MKVFLGGTCSGYNWRAKFIPMLKCDYYNPIVKNWSEEDRVREVKEREQADIVLYVITNGLKGVYSIAEVVDDSNKRPSKVVFCVLKDGIDSQMKRSLDAVMQLIKANGGYVCDSLEKAASYINGMA